MIKLKFNQSMIDEALNKSKQIGILKDSFRKGKGQQHGLLAEFAVKEYFKDLIKPTENFYNNDLTIADYKVEIKSKTLKQVKDITEWSIAKTSSFQKPDYYFFVNVNYNENIKNTNEIYLAGYISHKDFYNRAKFYPKGYQHKGGFTSTGGKSPIDHYNIFQYELTCVSKTTIFGQDNGIQLKLSI